MMMLVILHSDSLYKLEHQRRNITKKNDICKKEKRYGRNKIQGIQHLYILHLLYYTKNFLRNKYDVNKYNAIV